MLKLNLGSGQRPFGSGWINVDSQEKWREASDKAGGEFLLHSILTLPFADGSAEMIVAHHLLEHFDPAVGDQFVRECHRTLAKGGSLLVFVPNMRALAQRWLLGQLSHELFMINVYGPYMGSEDDRHKQGFTAQSLEEYLKKVLWSAVKPFDARHIQGADIAAWDWWILERECVK